MAHLYPTSGTLRKARPWRAFSFPAYEPRARAAHKKARQVAGKGNKHSG